MTAFAVGPASGPARNLRSAWSWPDDDDPLRLPRGPICDAVVSAVLAGGRRLAPLPAALAGLPLHPRQLQPLASAAGERRVRFAGPGEASGLAALEAVSPLTLDVLLVLLDLLARGGGRVPVNARAVLARKGFRRWGHERQVFENKVNEELRRLSRLELQGACGAAPLLAFAPRNVARTDFMVEAGAELLEELDLQCVLELPVAVLRLDHRANRQADSLAKRLALALVEANAPGVFSLAELLLRLGEVASPHRLAHDLALAGRLKAALGKLSALQVFDIAAEPARGDDAQQAWWAAEVAVRPANASAPHRPGRSFQVVESATVPAEAKPRCGRGRPKFEPTLAQRALVRRLSAAGATRELIAGRLGVSLPTLRRYFAAEFAPLAPAAEVVDS